MRTHLEIDSKNLVHNLHLFHKLTKRKLMFVVKANAYGHGIKEVVNITKDFSFIGYYVVDSVSEALQVKGSGVRQPILVIGWSDPSEFQELASAGFETVISSMDHLRMILHILGKMRTRVRCHIKVETGTARLGMEPEKVAGLVNIRQSPFLDIVGIYSHFANIEDTTDPTYARMQMQRFLAVLKKLKNRKLLRHFSCSASALLFPETYFDMVRVGVSAYGYWPSKETYLSYLEKNGHAIELKRVLSWHAQIAQIKHLAKGTPIGYGLTYKALTHSKIAVIPVGYYDGFDRRLSNLGQVIVKDELAPIRGRICMNMSMIEVSHIPGVKMGEKVILLGGTSKEKVDADTLADWTGTINYEILARLNPLIPRMVV